MLHAVISIPVAEIQESNALRNLQNSIFQIIPVCHLGTNNLKNPETTYISSVIIDFYLC